MLQRTTIYITLLALLSACGVKGDLKRDGKTAKPLPSASSSTY